jgi:hypothetical protein
VKPHFPACILAAAAVCSAAGRASASEFVRFEKFEDEEVVSQSFGLERPVRLRVVCTGAGDGDADEMYAYGWILDLRTREIVWSLPPAKNDDDRNITFDGSIDLPAGAYVANYAAFGGWRGRVKVFKFLGKEMFRFEFDDKRKVRKRDTEKWGLRISVADADDSAVDRHLPPTAAVDARTIVQMTGAADNVHLDKGFTLSAPMRITVYCIGEGHPRDEEMADTGWIINADTRERVWGLGLNNAEHAGGAPKNRYARDTITLPAGNYVVHYVTDDSHAHDSWNAPPPYDPDAWGITVWAPTAEDARRVRPYDDERRGNALVSIIRQGNDAYATQGLTVTRPLQVQVYALGEFSDHGFVDGGWITDFKSGRKIWEMSGDNTHPAGGAAKNRFADQLLSLAPGKYVVYYETDDSHAYPHWNAGPPSDPTHWGITLSPRGRNVDASSFSVFDPEAQDDEGKEFLVRLIRVGSDKHVRKRFKLDHATRVHILAFGEGIDREMYDYGWIEDAEGKPVWEMTMRNTDHAGGAAKNRVYDDVIRLERGEYEANFVTDGSHAWLDWNDTKPPDPRMWGLTVELESTGGR